MSETAHLKARRGDLIVFSTGEYSDYGYTGHFVALEDITGEHFASAKEDAERRFREEEEAKGWCPGGDKHEMFIVALIRAGLLVSVAVTEHHIGSYGSFDL